MRHGQPRGEDAVSLLRFPLLTGGMKSSKKDLLILRIWLKLIVCFVLMFITSATLPVAAMFPGLGFPCYFNNLVNYGAINLRAMNQARHLTPTLFLEAPEMFFYVVFSFGVDLLSLMYYIFAAVAILRARKHADGLTVLSRWIMAAGSPTLVYMGIFKLWTIQLFVHTLSYKHIYMAAFVYCIHWLLSVVYTECYITNVSSAWGQSELKRNVPPNLLLYRVIHYFKPIMMNVHLACIAVETLVFCLSFMMAVGNSFYVMVSDIVFGAVNLFLILPIIWYLVTEFWLSRYLAHQFGFHFGVLIASIMLTLPIIRYEHIFVNAHVHYAIAINVAIIPLCAFLALIIRAGRIYCAQKRVQYASVRTLSGLRKIRESAAIPLRKRQTPESSIVMEEESDSEADIDIM